MQELFQTEQLDMAGVIAMIERDLPECPWGVGVCQACCHPDGGPYAALIYTPDYHDPVAGLVMTEQGPKQVTLPGRGWCAAGHGASVLEALTRAYGLAMEKAA